MKYCYLFLWLLWPTFAPAWQHTGKSDTAKQRKQPVKVDSVVKKAQTPDTVKIPLKDSAALGMPVLADSTRIILIQQEGEKDSAFYRYWFPFISLILAALAGAACTLLAERVRTLFITRRAGRRWIDQSKIYVRIIESQQKLIEEFLAKEDPNKWIAVPLNRTSGIDGEQFSAFSQEELLKYLEVNLRMKGDIALTLLSNLTGTLSSLKLTYTQLDDDYKFYLQTISRCSHDTTKLLMELRTAFDAWVIAAQQRGLQAEEQLFTTASQLFKTEALDKMGNSDLDILGLEASLYIPLLTQLRPHLNVPEIYDVLKVVEACKNTVARVKGEKGYMTDNAKTLLKRYGKYREELSKYINEIVSYKNKKE